MNKVIPLFAFSFLLIIPAVAMADDFETRRDTYIGLLSSFSLDPPSTVDSTQITVQLIGNPILPGEPDTIVQRDPTPVPPQGSSTGPIQTEMVQLELKSIGPITTSTGDWNIEVELVVPLPPLPPLTGFMTITKDHPNGGVFSSQIPITPKFTFTKTDGSQEVERTYDALLDIQGQPWEHLPCPNSFFPLGPVTWAISTTSTFLISGTLNLEPILPDDQCIVGGKALQIEQTSLILAGAQSFSWMIPVTLSILGIGLFVYRKSENS